MPPKKREKKQKGNKSLKITQAAVEVNVDPHRRLKQGLDGKTLVVSDVFTDNGGKNKHGH